MFYLKEFLKVLKDNLVLSFIFVISFSLFMTSSHNKNIIEKELSLDGKVKSSPYFNALVSTKTNLKSVVRKMKSLPGVASVSINKQKNLNSEIKSLKRMFGENVIQSLSALNYKKVKIELEKGTKLKNQSLIREYLTKLVGSGSLTIGNIKKPRKVKLNKDDSLMSLLSWGGTYLILVSFGLFVISTILIIKEISQVAFLIERFQRKSLVQEKIVTAGFGFLVLIISSVNIYYNDSITLFSLLSILIILLIGVGTSFVFSKKDKWV